MKPILVQGGRVVDPSKGVDEIADAFATLLAAAGYPVWR